jgi:heme o synthase
MRALLKKLGPYGELCKVRIALFSAFSTATGFTVSSGQITPQMVVLVLGVFLLACGASVLNQHQEKDIDALMPRTKDRPIPSIRIRPLDALYFSLILICSGLFALLLVSGPSAPLFGLFALGWYNGVYTFLKRKTSFAVIPGALLGAVPVAIGWTAGGGIMNDPKLWMICFFFFMWQIPHSWLFILNYGREYEMAGLPSLTAVFSKAQLVRINFIWMISVAVSCLLMTVSGAIRSSAVNVSLFILSVWLIGNGIRLFGASGRGSAFSLAFSRINIYMFFVMSLLTADKLF